LNKTKISLAIQIKKWEHNKNIILAYLNMTYQFGGNWTENKLAVMQRYFSAYAQALKNQPFAKWYVDAFAGTGQRSEAKANTKNQAPLFESDEPEFAIIKDGSVRVALAIDPAFGNYVFNEQSKNHAAELEKLKQEFPNRKIEIRQGDANEFLQSVASTTNWKSTRAAVFIDPYGMQVSWETLKALSATKSVDIALLFPTGPLTRVLTRDGDIPEEWVNRTNDHLGPCDWRDAVYEQTSEDDLFSNAVLKTEKTLTPDGLRQFVAKRLATIFPYVSETQLELKNSKGATLYHLFIICANPVPAAINLAKKLARSAMKLPSKHTR
jgi:three-Cys-motif partner protein